MESIGGLLRPAMDMALELDWLLCAAGNQPLKWSMHQNKRVFTVYNGLCRSGEDTLFPFIERHDWNT